MARAPGLQEIQKSECALVLPPAQCLFSYVQKALGERRQPIELVVEEDNDLGMGSGEYHCRFTWIVADLCHRVLERVVTSSSALAVTVPTSSKPAAEKHNDPKIDSAQY